MKALALLAALGAVVPPAAAQPLPVPPGASDTPVAAAPPAPTPDLLGCPPGAIPVPGAPGAYMHPDVPEGYVVIDGDIQVRLEDYLVYLAGGDAVFGDVDLWSTHVVPFDFVLSGAGAVTAANQQNAINAMNAIGDRTGVIFRPAVSGDSSRIRFQNSTGNNSPVGRQGGTQVINIVSWNSQFTIIHELYHSLGFWHQQSASNRDSYVIINTANISTTACNGSCAHNFAIRSGASLYGGYDFDSFMHYPRWAFSGNGMDTITVREPWNAQWQNAIGQTNHFSYFDEIVCRGLYRRPSDYWWQVGAGGNGYLTNPIGGALPARMSSLPAGSTLFIKNPGSYSAIGVYTNPITIEAPTGATLGN